MDGTASGAIGAEVLTKDISPSHALGIGDILPKDDPVLAYLAVSDEREYSRMFNTSTAISGAVEQRINGLVAEGSEVTPGSTSPAAKLLRDFAVTQLKVIPHWPRLQREMLMAVFWGWRPVELRWGEFRFRGRSHFGVVEATAREPWHHAVSREGQIVHLSQGHGAADPSEEGKLRWLRCTANGGSSPYGVAWFRRLWLLYFLAQSFDKMSSQAMQRALGILKASRRSAEPPPAPGSQSLEGLPAELGRVAQVLTSNNVLIEATGWDLELISQAEAMRTTRDMLAFLDERMTTAIVGQNLTTKVEAGSFAAEQGHHKILESFFKGCDAPQLADWVNDQLLARVVQLNFGEIDAEDMPRWRCRVTPPSLEAARAAYHMGVPIDARVFADRFGVPVMFDPGPGDAVIQNPTARARAAARQRPPAEESRQR